MPAEDHSPPIKKRRPWLAALLSLLCPGLGQVYNTQIKFGFRLFALSLSLIVLAGIIMTVPPVSTAVVIVFLSIGLAGLGVIIWAVIAAFISARRAGDARLTRYNRLLVYVAMYSLVAVITEAGTGKWSPYMRWEAFNIPAASMIPSLEVGDHLISWRFVWRKRAPEHGELVIFKLPRDISIDYVKRIIGLPGDTIQMRQGRLVLNGTEVQRDLIEDYEVSDHRTKAQQYIETLPNGRRYKIIETRGDHGVLDNTRIYRVPVGHIFVLGDNRDNSTDSRVLKDMSPSWVGFVPLENLYSKPTIIYWARDKSRIGLRVK